MKRTPLTRRTPLRTKARINPVNRKRRARLRERNFGPRAVWIMGLPCCVPGCGKPSGPPHHVKTRGAGGDKHDQVPICWLHHCEVHSLGRVTFERKCQIHLTELAAHYSGLFEQ